MRRSEWGNVIGALFRDISFDNKTSHKSFVLCYVRDAVVLVYNCVDNDVYSVLNENFVCEFLRCVLPR